jgi:hypothetical protein
MTNRDIFGSAIFDLPKHRGKIDFCIFINEQLDEYLKAIKRFKGEVREQLSPKLSIITNQITLIKDAIEKYYHGFPADAYEQIANALNALEYNGILPIQKVEINSQRSDFFRIRVSDNKSLRKEDLFHIPFNLRERVGTQRYSIPGLPCLYLGDSIFVCWEELNRPDINQIHVSRFDLSKSNFKFLYLNVSVNDIRSRCFPNNNLNGKLVSQLIGFLCYWPLLAACSVIVENKNEVFKPEYIIPQLTLQWVVSTKILDGVIYKSCNVQINAKNIGTFANVVLPIKKVQDEGLCPILKSKVKLTTPVSWQLLDISAAHSVHNLNTKDINISDLRRAMYIELLEGERTDYAKTKFGILEEKLISMIPSLIK